jgi:hypothetical protein
MTISERARSTVQEMPERERPISEQFRIVARHWVEADKAANILEECKSAVLSKLMMAQGDMAVSKAEMLSKASKEWQEHLDMMVSARADANLRKVQMEFIRMQFSEWQSNDANARRERHMGRQAT